MFENFVFKCKYAWDMWRLGSKFSFDFHNLTNIFRFYSLMHNLFPRRKDVISNISSGGVDIINTVKVIWFVSVAPVSELTCSPN